VNDRASRPAEHPVQRLPYLIKRLEMVERARMEELLRPLGITVNQYTLLSILERREGLSSAQLARRHFVTPQAMHQLIASMERDQLIVRRPDVANRRVLRAWLSAHGAEVLATCHRAVDDFERLMLSALTSDEAVMFGRLIERCLATLDESDPPVDDGVVGFG
jgi:DNA-binding MarR family transcriptional regulator